MRRRLKKIAGIAFLFAASAQAQEYQFVYKTGLVSGWETPSQASYTSCRDALTKGGSHGSGEYDITLANGNSFRAYCDMTTDGGGWMLVLNYLHKGGLNNNLTPMTGTLPLKSGDNFGVDGSLDVETWGHASPAMMANLNMSELRFSCKTSAHNRVIESKTDNVGLINYFKTGTGVGSNLAFTKLPGDTSSLTGFASSKFNYYPNAGNEAMTRFPFFISGNYHWGIKGNTSRWECDDYVGTWNYHTLHRIWVR